MLPHTQVYVSNNGHSGSTTEDAAPPNGWLTHGSGNVESKADALIVKHPEGTLIFSIMLGTNDSANSGTRGSPMSAQTYGKNMKRITDELIAKYPQCKIFIHHSTWFSKNTHNFSDYEGDGPHNRLLSYFPVIDAMAKEDSKSVKQHIYPGDTDAYDYFAKNYNTELSPQQGKNGTFYLHPNVKGSQSLGNFWAAAIAKEELK